MLNPLRKKSGMSMSFDSEYNRTAKRINIGFVVITIISTIVSVFVILGIIFLIKNPEAIGEFFGKIGSGFNSVN